MTIGLTYTGDEKKHDNYVRWLRSNDNTIIIKKLDVKENVLNDFDECDALVLSGGIDISPSFAKSDADYSNKPSSWYPERDEFEAALYKIAITKGLPILGICRGMQLINVIEGGTLHQDLGELNTTHRFESRDKKHSIQIDQASLMYDITRVSSSHVSSAHHQAIDQVADSLTASCYADDGTIEGLEWKDQNNKSFLLCVQWHPERMFDDFESPASKNIRDTFIKAISTSIRHYESH